MPRIRIHPGSAVLVLSLAVPAAAPAAELQAEPASATDNLAHVANVEFPEFRGGGARATDSDFTEFQIPRGAAGGTRSPAGPWRLPTPEENGGMELPSDYRVRPGESRVFNLMGTYQNGMFVTDVTDPERPVVVSRWDCGVTQGDVAVFEQGTRVLAAYTLDATATLAHDSDCATDLGLEPPAPLHPADRIQKGTFIADVTDPYRPRTVSFIEMRKGTHTVTVHPSGRYLYNSAAVVVTERTGSIEVYDVSTPEAPELATELELVTGLDSHDMTFSEDGDRLYVAALTHSLVIDTSDPADPVIVGRILDPAINIHHDAHAVTLDTPDGERTFMLIGDEIGGAAPTGVCPGGGIHVYDITGSLERDPVKVGAFFIPEVRATAVDAGGVRTCTAHVIQALPGTTLLSVAWYNGGVRVLDYAGLAGIDPVGVSVGVGAETLTPGIREIGHLRFSDSSLWSAKVHEVEDDGSFYIFGGDTRRHLEIFRFTAGGDVATAAPGRWLTAASALERAASTPVPDDYRAYCLLG